MVKFFFSYIGGKIKDIKFLKEHIDLTGITTICEPFAGSFAFSRSFSVPNYIINDIDSNLIQFYQDVQNGNFQKYIDYVNTNKQQYYDNNKTSSEWYKLRQNKTHTLYNWFLIKCLSIKGSMLNLTLCDKKIEIKNYEPHIDFLKGNVKLMNKDYKDIFKEQMNNKKCLMFLDPPYLDSYNSSYNKHNGKTIDSNENIIDNTQIFIDILELLKNAKCKIVFIINSNAITKYIYHDFIKCEYDKRYDITGRKTKHLIIMN